MEQNGLQIRNQRTHISLEHYDSSLHQKNAYFLLTSVIHQLYVSTTLTTIVLKKLPCATVGTQIL